MCWLFLELLGVDVRRLIVLRSISSGFGAAGALDRRLNEPLCMILICSYTKQEPSQLVCANKKPTISFPSIRAAMGQSATHARSLQLPAVRKGMMHSVCTPNAPHMLFLTASSPLKPSTAPSQHDKHPVGAPGGSRRLERQSPAHSPINHSTADKHTHPELLRRQQAPFLRPAPAPRLLALLPALQTRTR